MPAPHVYDRYTHLRRGKNGGETIGILIRGQVERIVPLLPESPIRGSNKFYFVSGSGFPDGVIDAAAFKRQWYRGNQVGEIERIDKDIG